MSWWDEWKSLKEPELPLLWACGASEAVLALLPALLHQALFDWAVPSGNTQNLILVLGLLVELKPWQRLPWPWGIWPAV